MKTSKDYRKELAAIKKNIEDRHSVHLEPAGSWTTMELCLFELANQLILDLAGIQEMDKKIATVVKDIDGLWKKKK